MPEAQFLNGQHREAQPAPAHLAEGQHLVEHPRGQVGGDCKADSAAAEFVDADDLAPQVHKRTARVARQDQRIVLDPAREDACLLPLAEVQVKHLGAGKISKDPLGVGHYPQRQR